MVINTLQYDVRYTQRHINTLQYDARYTQRHINTLQYDARYTQRHIIFTVGRESFLSSYFALFVLILRSNFNIILLTTYKFCFPVSKVFILNYHNLTQIMLIFIAVNVL